MFLNTANGADGWKCSLNIEWHDCSWCPSIGRRPGIATRPGASVLPNPVRRNNLVRPMKKIANRQSPIVNSPGFTLVEMLVVIAIIGILAAMLLPALAAAKTAAKKAQAKTEMSSIVTAIESYDQDYSRYPITKAEQTAAGTNDFSTGFVPNPQANITWPAGAGGNYSDDNNSNVVAILMDMTAYPNGVPTANANHVYNPKQVKYLNAKMASDTNSPGVGPDLVYRDPWGNPYVITMNTSYNEQGTSDIFYSQQTVSRKSGQTGYNGLFNPIPPGNTDNFLYHGKVMVWSAGQDRKIDSTDPATDWENRNNVLSWQ